MPSTHNPSATDEVAEPKAAPSARSREEEKINTLTHALGAALSVVGFELLLARATHLGDSWQLVGCAVYASSLVAVYAASTLSHSFQRPRLRRFFRILDQAFIFLLIAGTFTPISLTYLRGGPWWFLFGLMWAIAMFGFVSKTIFAHQIESVSTALHITMGWLPVLALKPMLTLLPGGLIWSMLYGGLCYTGGTFFLMRDHRVRHFHAIWHLLVIAGSAFHYWGIYWYCTAAPA
ncbi:MAG TPA: hemolysin III family protein [Pirellulales bacterium]|nr:hemolysin III family protein [Pirellulales bacterium]